MSRSAKGKILPKKGRSFPESELERAYASAIAMALRQDVGSTHHSIKMIMRWTGAKERTVKNWLAKNSGPSGAYLIGLIRHSDAVFEAVLVAAGRNRTVQAEKLVAARVQLEFMLETIRALEN